MSDVLDPSGRIYIFRSLEVKVCVSAALCCPGSRVQVISEVRRSDLDDPTEGRATEFSLSRDAAAILHTGQFIRYMC